MLGFVEAAYFPGCLYYLSCWYTRAELGFRYSILYSGALISGAFSGLMAAGIVGNMDHLHGLRSWRWLFIIEGTITIGIAAAAFFILPNFPRTTMWLSEEERQLAAWRMEEDVGEDDWVDSESQSFLNGIKLALIDIKTWILVSCYWPTALDFFVEYSVLGLTQSTAGHSVWDRLVRLCDELLPLCRWVAQLH